MDDLHRNQKQAMEGRWFAQFVWFDRKARAAGRWHYLLRIVAILGGIAIPALVNVTRRPRGPFHYVNGAILALGLLVAASVALEEFFRWGERWRHYRHTAEMLKSEGWSFIEFAGRYAHRERPTHSALYPAFAARVEDLIRHDVQVYLTRIAPEQQEDVDRDRRRIGKEVLGRPDSTPSPDEA